MIIVADALPMDVMKYPPAPPLEETQEALPKPISEPDTVPKKVPEIGDVFPKAKDEEIEPAGQIQVEPHPETAFKELKTPPSPLDVLNTGSKLEKIWRAIRGNQYNIRFTYTPLSAKAGESIEREIQPPFDMFPAGTGNTILQGVDVKDGKTKSFALKNIWEGQNNITLLSRASPENLAGKQQEMPELVKTEV